MGFFSKIFGSKQNTNINNNFEMIDSFNKEEYDRYNNAKIKEFVDKYDLSSKEGIMLIPISEVTKYPDVIGISVVYMPEQILSRKATEYKKEKKYDLAIECLRKMNELLPYSPFGYNRNDYERIVDMMILAGRYNEAKIEHENLNKKFGTRLEELQKLQISAVKTHSESKEDYQKRVIDPYIEEKTDREHYYWLLENMPNIAPKSFGGYRTMKKNKTNNYFKIINELKKVGKDINELKFWK